MPSFAFMQEGQNTVGEMLWISSETLTSRKFDRYVSHGLLNTSAYFSILPDEDRLRRETTTSR